MFSVRFPSYIIISWDRLVIITVITNIGRFTFKRTHLTDPTVFLVPLHTIRNRYVEVGRAGEWCRYLVSMFLFHKIGQTVSHLPFPCRISVCAFIGKFERPIGLFVRFFINISIVQMARNKIGKSEINQSIDDSIELVCNRHSAVWESCEL